MRISFRCFRSALALVGAVAILSVNNLSAADPAPSAGEPNPDTVVVTVNSEPVHAWELSLMASQVGANMGRQGQPPSQEEVLQAAMQQLVQTKLLAQEATRRGLKAKSDRVAETLQGIDSQSGGRDTLVANLKNAGLTYDQLAAAVAEADLVQVFIETEIEPKIAVSDEEVASYYAANPDRFGSPEQVRARHILFKAGPEATPEEQNAARQKAEAARERALAGEDFAELAKELSEGPSGPKGGDLGFFDKARMVEPFASAAFAMQPGDISKVVKTQFGFHVIKVEERKPAGTMTLDEVKPRLAEMLRQQRFRTELEGLVEGLAKSADIVVQPGMQGAPDAASPSDTGDAPTEPTASGDASGG
jgi:peptidyl-prolyl cis-trans isomerase C